ncbi:MAG: S-layer homology domain-containing protein [Ruminococcaceae bacterium]|nr:S-layer homology domain-containing protein [Oscillospiraceae bacterium]
MKKRTALLSLLLAAALLLGFASAAGGDANDPLISLDYLQSVFRPQAEQAMQDRMEASGNMIYERTEDKWREAVAALGGESAAVPACAAEWTEACLKQNDLLSGVTGTMVMLLTGSVAAQFASGAVVDVTDGTELPSGTVMLPRHRYMVAEDTAATFTVISRTAVLDYCGGYRFSVSSGVPDYHAMASALKALSLFRGTDTGYGSGFDLEAAPSRMQALVMLIRLLGEEEEALACTSPAPFKDIVYGYWGRPYVAYAYEQGYTNGVEGNKFAPERTASEGMYVEFVLRALGYSDTTQTDVSTAAERAVEAGFLTPGEASALQSNDFLRADVVYLSWYALGVQICDETISLSDRLREAGVFTDTDYRAAAALVTSRRL